MFARLLPLLALASCTTGPGDTAAPAKKQAAMPVPNIAGSDSASFVSACKDWDDWDKPAPPFRIMGGTWHVGTCGISSILIADPAGHILIDTGTEIGAGHILANIRKIGVDPKDIRYIFSSHEHFDHVGGHAVMVRATGAQVVSSARAAEVLRTGLTARDDPQADSDHPAMTPVDSGRIVADGEEIVVANDPLTTQNRLKAHATPGHTPGALSWSWTACALPGEPPACRRIVYADSLSPVSADAYRFSDHPALVASFRKSFDTVAALPCDTLLTPHPSASNLLTRLKSGDIWAQGQCATYAASLRERLDKRLAQEVAKGG
ncbi:MAG: subclass B3 metallo-beta-lactamase [Tsuneonella sp.]